MKIGTRDIASHEISQRLVSAAAEALGFPDNNWTLEQGIEICAILMAAGDSFARYIKDTAASKDVERAATNVLKNMLKESP